MAIRYDKKFNNEIRRIVNNYNAKIRRLEKINSDVILPDKFNKDALESLKGSVSNRKDLRWRLKDLETFTQRGAEKNIVVDGAEIPKYQYQNIRRYQSLVKRRINTKIKFYETKKATNAGKKEDVTFAQMGERDYLNALAKKELLLDKDISNLTNEERENLLRLLQNNSRTISIKNWQDNYIEILNDTGRTYGYNNNKLEVIKILTKRLDPSKFDKLFKTERTIQQIIYYYKPIKDFGIDLNIEDNVDDVTANFDNLYDNMFNILEDYTDDIDNLYKEAINSSKNKDVNKLIRNLYKDYKSYKSNINE